MAGYFLLSGRPAFESESNREMATQALSTPTQRPSRVALQSIPQELDFARCCCLTKLGANRSQKAVQLIRVSDAWLGGHPWPCYCELETERLLAQAHCIDDWRWRDVVKRAEERRRSV